MKKKITEEFVTERVRQFLSPKWVDARKDEEKRNLHSKGCDLILKDSFNKHQARRFYIECKHKSQAKSAKSVNETQWIYALGQLMTRMSVVARHAYLYGLGLPKVGADKALRRIPWQAARHLCLHIFSVDDDGKVTMYSPKDFKSRQQK